eukprot:1877903-Lingulodinium_polyedra.AAC.1
MRERRFAACANGGAQHARTAVRSMRGPRLAACADGGSTAVRACCSTQAARKQHPNSTQTARRAVP